MRRPTPGRVYFANAPIRLVIEEAYGVRPDRLLNVPDWDAQERFEIVATYNAELRGQTALMLRALLEDRFSLRVHRETREMPIYELVKARADGQLGPGLRPSTNDCAAPAGQRSPCTLRIGSNFVYATGTSWGFLANNIGVWDRPIVDKTGLSGPFDVKLDWTPDPALARSPEGAARAAEAVGSAPGERLSIFTALQEQLGLKLEATRGPLEVLVVDRLERPTPD
jgi:uncharacterized protein (TIGR03435 family)